MSLPVSLSLCLFISLSLCRSVSRARLLALSDASELVAFRLTRGRHQNAQNVEHAPPAPAPFPRARTPCSRPVHYALTFAASRTGTIALSVWFGTSVGARTDTGCPRLCVLSSLACFEAPVVGSEFASSSTLGGGLAAAVELCLWFVLSIVGCDGVELGPTLDAALSSVASSAPALVLSTASVADFTCKVAHG